MYLCSLTLTVYVDADIRVSYSSFGVGAICGPIIGGAFTSEATWRWCFYVNLPVGAITFLTLIFFFHPQNHGRSKESFRQKLQHLDAVGNFLLITAVIMLLLALQWGGVTYVWSDSRIIGLLVGAGMEFLVFIAWLVYHKDAALIPLGVISQRTVAASFTSAFFLSGTLLILTYYLPYWFQAIKDNSAIASGVHTIAYLAANFTLSIIAGAMVQKTGYFSPPAILGAAVATVGAGLITTLKVDTSTARWIGYQILIGAGIGMAIQQGVVAVQVVLPQDLVPIATSLILFSQSLSGAVFVSVGSSILRNKLESGLEAAKLPGVNVVQILDAGATEVRSIVPADQLQKVLVIYNNALDKVFIIAVPLAAMAMVCAFGLEWRSLKGRELAAG